MTTDPGATTPTLAEPPRPSGWRPALAALAAGSLYPLGFAPLNGFVLPFASLMLLVFLLQRAPSARRAATLGFAWGLGCFSAGISWVYVSMHDVGGMAAPLAALATLLFAAWLALFPALAAVLRWRLASHSPGRDSLLFAAAWCLAELGRGYLLTGFPWLALGYSQLAPSPLAGYAPIIGVYGVGFLAAWLAAAGLSLLENRRNIPLALSALILLGVGAGLTRITWTTPAGPPLRVNLAQGNIPQSLKWDPTELARSVDAYRRLAARPAADLLVLPETAIPLLLGRIPADLVAELSRQSPLVLGAAIDRGNDRYLNAAVLLPQADQLELAPQAYAKRHLVPFGEFIPPGFDWFFRLVNIPMTSFTPGSPGQRPLGLGSHRLWPTVCYEDLFGEELVSGAAASTLLLNLSNTAWFGHSLAQPQHFQIARMRSLETGRPMIRATNTGMTGAIDADGRVLAVLPQFSEDLLTVTVQGRQGLTPYLRWGNSGCLVLALLALAPALLRRRS